MARLASFVLLLSLSGCGLFRSKEITACEASVKAGLRSPSTYNRISADSYAWPIEKPKMQKVVIEYDAANVFGTPVRDIGYCFYASRGDTVDTGNAVDPDTGNPSKAVDDIANELDAEGSALENEAMATLDQLK